MISKILPPLTSMYLLVKCANVILSKVHVILVAWLSSRDVTMACSRSYCIICKVCKSACHHYLGIWKWVRLYFLFLAITNNAYSVLVFFSLVYIVSVSHALFSLLFSAPFCFPQISPQINMHQIHPVKGSLCHALNHLQSQMEYIQTAIIPDIVALKQAVRVLRLVGLLALDGPKPPGVINHRPKAVTCTHMTVNTFTGKQQLAS